MLNQVYTFSLFQKEQARNQIAEAVESLQEVFDLGFIKEKHFLRAKNALEKAGRKIQ